MTTTDTDTIVDTSDVAAALDAARPNVDEILLAGGPPGVAVLVVRDDTSVQELDLERHLLTPRRPTGTTTALTAAGFVDLFHKQVGSGGDLPAAVYADVDACTLTAVLNDDEAGVAHWRDFRIAFAPQATPEWKHWVGGQGLRPQEEFAAILEGGETEIRTPSATVMLELAETFHASTTAKFKQAGRRRDGRVQLAYEEEIEATAGEGLVDIPETFTIELRPFYGAGPVTVDCRLRFRLNRGELTIGYSIHRPEEIRRRSFETDVLAGLRDQLTGFPVIEATPAPPR